jgi:transcriptional regulator with XRE-family HTH domain
LARLQGMVAEYDQRFGRLLRLIRRQSQLTQEELSIASGVPVRDIAAIERGDVGLISVERVRQAFAALGARARVTAWWNGAAADRLLDERHADVLERASRVMAKLGWQVPTEVTFSEFGERGSIDIFGHRRAANAIAVCEVKSAFGSLEETNRTLDTKTRLAPKLCQNRFGWAPRHVAKLLIVPDESTIRRIVAAHSQTMDSLYPARSREVRAWLRAPDQNLAGIWFLSDPRIRRTKTPEAE